jgi:hypothetical protein
MEINTENTPGLQSRLESPIGSEKSFIWIDFSMFCGFLALIFGILGFGSAFTILFIGFNGVILAILACLSLIAAVLGVLNIALGTRRWIDSIVYRIKSEQELIQQPHVKAPGSEAPNPTLSNSGHVHTELLSSESPPSSPSNPLSGSVQTEPLRTGTTDKIQTIPSPIAQNSTDAPTNLPPVYGQTAPIVYEAPGSGTKYAPTLLSPHFGCYVVPREGTSLEHSQDKFAYNAEKCRYAVADGVGTSFLPGYWAKVVTEHFTSADWYFTEPQQITEWLMGCSHAWYDWVETSWVPLARQNSGQSNWDREIEAGAAATFAGCSFSPQELAQQGKTTAQVVVVGDAEFFHLVRNPDLESVRFPWKCKAFYHLKLEDFGHTTEALATPIERVKRDYKWVHRIKVPIQMGDCLLLVTDALAKWILQSMHKSKDPWSDLLALYTQQDFEHFVRNNRAKGSLEIDDTTLMIIPLDGMPPLHE